MAGTARTVATVVPVASAAPVVLVAQGGGGGGAFEIEAEGQIVVNGQLLAQGGNGTAGLSGAAFGSGTSGGIPGGFNLGNSGGGGDNGTDFNTGFSVFFGGIGGSAGSTQIAGGDGSAGVVIAGGGGGGGGGGGIGEFGGFGSTGGNGGSGGTGGTGGGGAGGTVEVIGSVVSGSGATVNGSGGIGGNSGGNGRFIFGTDTSGSFGGSTTGVSTTTTTGTVDANPFVSGTPNTPFIPNLVGGAEAFGLTTLTASAFSSVLASEPAGTGAALYRVHIGPTGYANDFTGYDAVFLINTSGGSLSSPQLGAGTAGYLQDLLQEGYLNEPNFGGSGAQTLASLAANGVFMTLVPSGTSPFNASFVEGGTTYSASGVSLANGSVYYLSTPLTYNASSNPTITHYTLEVNSGLLQLVNTSNPSNVLASQPLTNTTSVSITGNSGGSDVLTINFGNSYFSVPGGISFNGGSTIAGVNGGTLDVNGSTFQTITDTLTGPGAGNLLYHPSSGSNLTVTYSGLLPVSTSGTSTNFVINLPAGVTDASLSAGSAGMETISSTSNAFESTTFADPSQSLTINSTAGAADALTINALNSSFTAGLSVNLSNNTSGTSTISLVSPLQVSTTGAASNVAFTAQQINLGAGISTVNGTQAGSVTLAGNVTVTASSQINYGGTSGLSIGTGTNTLTLNNATTLTLTDANAADAGSIASQITGAGGLTKSGPGTLTVSNSGNNYSGLTTISAGTLQLGVTNALPSGANLTVQGGTLDLQGHNQAVNALNVTGNGVVTDTGALVTLTVNGGGIINGATVGVGSNLNLTIGGTTPLVFSNGSISVSASTINNGATFQIGDPATTSITFARNAATTDNGTISFGAPFSSTGSSATARSWFSPPACSR